MIRTISLSVVLFVAAAFLPACSHSIAAPSSSAEQTTGSTAAALTLTDTLWKLQSFQRTDSTIVQVSDPTRFTIELGADGRLAVRADCNRCSASYSQTGDTLAVNPTMACTKAACSSAPFDYAYVTALADVTRVSASGNTLQWVSKQGVLTFAR